MSFRLFQCVALALVLAVPVATEAASRLTLVHAAHAIPEPLRFEVQGVGPPHVQVLTYREHAFVDVEGNGGVLQVLVKRADGGVLADLDRPDDGASFMVAFARRDPYSTHRIYVSLDHNRPIPEGSITVQSAHVADTHYALRLENHRGAPFPGFNSGGYERFGAGLETANLYMGPAAGCCTLRLRSSVVGEIATLAFTARPGGRYRYLAIGGGDAPVEIKLIEQNVEATLPSVLPDARMEGVWYAPDDPGVGFSISITPSASNVPRVDVFVHGYDTAGDAVWSFLQGKPDSPTLLDTRLFAGGTPDGGNAAVPIPVGSAELVFHTCDDATLVVHGGAERAGLRAWPSPRNAKRLKRMLPLTNCNGAGVRP